MSFCSGLSLLLWFRSPASNQGKSQCSGSFILHRSIFHLRGREFLSCAIIKVCFHVFFIKYEVSDCIESQTKSWVDWIVAPLMEDVGYKLVECIDHLWVFDLWHLKTCYFSNSERVYFCSEFRIRCTNLNRTSSTLSQTQSSLISYYQTLPFLCDNGDDVFIKQNALKWIRTHQSAAGVNERKPPSLAC